MSMKRLAILLFSAACLSPGAANAQAANRENITAVEVRPGVRLAYYAVWRENAVATLVLYSGGNGGFGRVQQAGGWPGSNNFLIRSAPMFAEHPFNVVLMGRATDTPELGYIERIGAQHLADNLAVLKNLKARSAAPIWLVGTSRGTVSVTAVAVNDTENLVSGLVLTSSITDYRLPGAVPKQELGRIKVPTLVVHHNADACKACPPHNAGWISKGLTSAPVKARLMMSGGEELAEGDPCEAMHTHGFRGIEPQVVSAIAAWVRNPQGN
jgi:pimeloyl-ACP methyl ester carboxylesterase